MHRANALFDAAVGIFHNHNRPVHKHPHRKDQTKHHDVGNGDPHEGQQYETQKERCGDRKTHKQGRAHTKRAEDHDHHKRNRGQNRSLKLADHRSDGAALVIGKANINRGLKLRRPFGDFLNDGLTHQRGCVDNVEPFAFHHLQRHSVFTVKTGGADAVFKGQVDLRQIAQGDHPLAIGLNRKIVNILRFVKAGRDLQGKSA